MGRRCALPAVLLCLMSWVDVQATSQCGALLCSSKRLMCGHCALPLWPPFACHMLVQSGAELQGTASFIVHLSQTSVSVLSPPVVQMTLWQHHLPCPAASFVATCS